MTEERDTDPGRDRPTTGAARRGHRSVATESDLGKGRPTPQRDGRTTAPSLYARVVKFLREVVAELQKVIWPNRNELVRYTIVVLIFVSFMVALIAGLDYVFARAVFAVFG